MAEYVKIPAINNKIRDAEEEYRPIYISGMAGFGKTAAVKYYLRRRSYEYLSGESGCLPKFPDPDTMRSGIIVIDDISWITDEESIIYITRLLFRKDIWVVLIGRSDLPRWLTMVDMEISILRANARDLVFTEKEVQELFEKYNVKLSFDMAHAIIDFSGGYAICIIYILKRMQTGEEFGPDLLAHTRVDMFGYCDFAFYHKWRKDLTDLLLAICEYDRFNIAMVEMLTGRDNVTEIIDYAESVGSFLRIHNDGYIEFNKFLHNYFKWKKSFVYKKEDFIRNYELAARYYEENNEWVLAAEYYKKAGRNDKIREILIRNAGLHPGVGHYFDLRKFYLEIPEEEAEQSPILMTALSLLYSIMMIPDMSEEWYEKLVLFSKNETADKKLRREAEARVAYLNIALPHRGITNIISAIKDAAILCTNKEFKIPSFSVTSNLPSLMNGGLDFCEWSKNDKELKFLLKKPLELVLGKTGKGLVDIAMAESGFEKATMDEYEITTKLNQGILMSEAGGTIEIGFAGTGVLIKQYVLRGQLPLAQAALNSFKKKIEKEKAVQLNQNMTALSIWLSLYQGDILGAEQWLKESPDESEEFCVMRRFQYMQKVRMLIATKRLSEALALIERLDFYYTQYQRTMLWIENKLLKAIVYSQLKFAQWQNILEEALKRAAEYHFVNVVALEGAAIKPLIDNAKRLSGDEAFDKEIINAVNTVARYYPDYLKNKENEVVLLTDKEKEILKLMVAGVTSEEICTQCGITYNSLKFHNKNIYKKLGVKSRTEAERKAVNLGIC